MYFYNKFKKLIFNCYKFKIENNLTIRIYEKK